MKRLLVALVCIAACHGADTKPSTESNAQTPSPAKPPAREVSGAPGTSPPAGQPGTGPASTQPITASQQVPPEPQPIDESVMDKSADACSNFYQYACGGWLKVTPIPEDRANWGRGFSEIHQRNEALLHEIMEKDAKGETDPADPFAKKVGDYYAACMDEEKAETGSLETLKAELAKINRIHDKKALATEVGLLQAVGANAFFGFGSQQDFKDATQVIGGADQGGLGLPDRDYYFDSDKKPLRDLYVDHVAKMLQLAGEPAAQAKKEAGAIMKLETALAKVSMDKVKRRDPYAIYNRIDRQGLEKAAPHFDWNEYFVALGDNDVTAISVAVPDFFKGMDKILAKPDWKTLQAYLRWKAIEGSQDTLGKAFVEEAFRMTSALTGAKAILPRWKRCVAQTDRALGEASGRTFVTTTIGDEGKAKAKDIIEGIEDAFQRNLATVEWMDDAARKASLEKLEKINNKVAYPSKWRDYSTMEIGRESPLANAIAAARFETKRDLNKIGKPVDRGEWGMTPPTVNAYYNPLLNEMVFPAGILQSPFFKTDAATAANYGGEGMVMGHELTHGFDDQGRQFDGNGNLREWWSKEVSDKFKERAACVAKQYDGYEATPGVHLNGKLTLGENLADIGGLKLALSALHKRLGDKATPDTDRNFFIAFAQTWCTNSRPEQLKLQAATNPHSTPMWRVNGPVSDNPDFAKAFSCKDGSPMAPPNRCGVW
ncbi:MAG TPA: M13-type metalloendopeptidase [Myxococcales bacterium]|jgi:endothelin-converting enzyme/putative endopeptidase